MHLARSDSCISRMFYSSLVSQMTLNQWATAAQVTAVGMDREAWSHLLKREELKAMNMQWVFLGYPGVGKGTYTSRLSQLLDIPHIATGDPVREELAQSRPSAEELASIVNQGKLVLDNILMNLLSRRLKNTTLKGDTSFILDGFLRTTRQAEIHEQLTEIELVC